MNIGLFWGVEILKYEILAEIIKKIPSWDYQTTYKQRTTIYML